MLFHPMDSYYNRGTVQLDLAMSWNGMNAMAPAGRDQTMEIEVGCFKCGSLIAHDQQTTNQYVRVYAARFTLLFLSKNTHRYLVIFW